MHFKELIKTRYSVREYHENKVNKTLIEQVINAGRLAPSAANRQPWKFVVINEDELLDKVKKAYERDWFSLVPCIIAIFGNHEVSWKRSYDGKDHCDVDAAIAIDHITLMAAELGLGTCWICHFNPDVVKDAIPHPDNWEPIALLSIGYPKNIQAPEKKRKELSDVISWNSFQ